MWGEVEEEEKKSFAFFVGITSWLNLSELPKINKSKSHTQILILNFSSKKRNRIAFASFQSKKKKPLSSEIEILVSDHFCSSQVKKKKKKSRKNQIAHVFLSIKKIYFELH